MECIFKAVNNALHICMIGAKETENRALKYNKVHEARMKLMVNLQGTQQLFMS